MLRPSESDADDHAGQEVCRHDRNRRGEKDEHFAPAVFGQLLHLLDTPHGLVGDVGHCDVCFHRPLHAVQESRLNLFQIETHASIIDPARCPGHQVFLEVPAIELVEQ